MNGAVGAVCFTRLPSTLPSQIHTHLDDTLTFLLLCPEYKIMEIMCCIREAEGRRAFANTAAHTPTMVFAFREEEGGMHASRKAKIVGALLLITL